MPHLSPNDLRFFAVTAADFALAAAFYPALRWRASRRLALLIPVLLLIALSPTLIPHQSPVDRFLQTLVAIGLSIRLYDAAIQANRGFIPTFAHYFINLPNDMWIVLRRIPPEAAWPRSKNLRLLIFRIAGTAVGLLLCYCAWNIRWTHMPFLLEHAAKVVPFYIVVIMFTGFAAALWRLTIGPALEPFHNPAAAPTPADFWRRWNRPTAQWLHEHVFLPLGGRRAPVRATLATFILSALIHEYVFGITIGRVQFYQTSFFVIQGIAAVLTLRLRPCGPARLLAIAVTFIFTLLTSILFFASITQIFPFYSRPIPFPLLTHR